MTIDTDDADPAVVVTENQAFLHRELFAPGAVDQEWLAVAPDAPVAELDLLRQALGVDLAGHARPSGFVPSGNQIAEAALEVAAPERRRPGRRSMPTDPALHEAVSSRSR